MSLNTIKPKTGRPPGVRSGSGKGSGRKKMMFGLYENDRERLERLSAQYDLSYAGVIRLSLLLVEAIGGMLRDTDETALSLITGYNKEDCSNILEIIQCKRQD